MILIEAFIALIHYSDGEKRYIIQPDGLKVGDIIVSSEKTELKTGNAMQLKNIPSGQSVHNIEMIPGKGAQMARSAGAYVQVMAHDNNYVTLKMPSGEVRMVPDKCLATIVSCYLTRNRLRSGCGEQTRQTDDGHGSGPLGAPCESTRRPTVR